MQIKVEKQAYLKITDITAYVNCTVKNIEKLMDVFDIKNKTEIVAEMSFSNEESFSLEKIEGLKFQHKASFEKNKHFYSWFRLIASPKECKDFLRDIFELDVEIISLVSIKDEEFWQRNSHNKGMSCRTLVRNGILDLCLTAVIDENTIDMTINKNIYDTKQTVSKIKHIFNSPERSF